MDHKLIVKRDNRYFVNIDITSDEWKAMLINEKIFTTQSLQMVLYWYEEQEHQATSKDIMKKYCPNKKKSPYNSIVKGLSQRIIRYLNRFDVEYADRPGSKCYWCIPFEGWHIKEMDTKERFVWKLRDELAEAMRELLDETLLENDSGSPIVSSLKNEAIIPQKEGKKVASDTTKYERSLSNRYIAIRNTQKKYGELCCEVCGFNFEKTYGERGKGFIEVHHNKPLSSLNGETEINPEKDLNCLCPNCHRMIHRKKDEILSVEQLKELMKRQRSKQSSERLK